MVAGGGGRAGGRAGALEAYALGLGDPVAISAEHGEGLADLYDALRTTLPGATAAPTEEAAKPAERPINVAVVGRPNSGKSTLVNRLLGEERLLTGPEAGITRDTIAVELTWQGRGFRFHDTAGLRRKSRIEEKLEKLSVADAINAIRFAEVVIVLMDVERPFEEQDLCIADLVQREGRALVLGMNKWDLVEKPNAGKLRTEADHWLPQVKGVPIVAVSGRLGDGVTPLSLNFARRSASLRAAVSALESFAMTAGGVLAGASTPAHWSATVPAKPCSTKVGTSGKISDRCVEVAASALSLPACTWPSTVGTSPIRPSSVPPRMSVIACDAPR